MSPLQSGVAACLLDAMTDKEASEALGIKPAHVNFILHRLRMKFNARNRVHLALRLQSVVIGEIGLQTFTNQEAKETNRAALVALCKKAPPLGWCTNELVRKSGLCKETCRAHLAALFAQGLVDRGGLRGSYRWGAVGSFEEEVQECEEEEPPFVHALVSANDASPMRVNAPNSVWSLAA